MKWVFLEMLVTVTIAAADSWVVSIAWLSILLQFPNGKFICECTSAVNS